MNPDEYRLLERTLKLSEDNNKILKKLQSKARWSTFWGFVQFLLIVVPLAAIYVYLQPYFGLLTHTLAQASTVLNSIK